MDAFTITLYEKRDSFYYYYIFIAFMYMRVNIHNQIVFDKFKTGLNRNGTSNRTRYQMY